VPRTPSPPIPPTIYLNKHCCRCPATKPCPCPCTSNCYRLTLNDVQVGATFPGGYPDLNSFGTLQTLADCASGYFKFALPRVGFGGHFDGLSAPAYCYRLSLVYVCANTTSGVTVNVPNDQYACSPFGLNVPAFDNNDGNTDCRLKASGGRLEVASCPAAKFGPLGQVVPTALYMTPTGGTGDCTGVSGPRFLNFPTNTTQNVLAYDFAFGAWASWGFLSSGTAGVDLVQCGDLISSAMRAPPNPPTYVFTNNLDGTFTLTLECAGGLRSVTAAPDSWSPFQVTFAFPDMSPFCTGSLSIVVTEFFVP
jgi:hypothetical protein